MHIRYTPKILIKYLIKEFCYSLIIFLSIFLSIIVLTTYIEEIFFFRERNISDNLFFKTFILSLIKTPTLLFNMTPFIFLFASIFFFVKLLRSNEITPLSLSGFSSSFVTLVPALFSFFLGIFLIFFFTPISSELSKYYESIKQKYIENDNLIIMSNTGLWLKENNKHYNETHIIRANRVKNQNFDKFENLTIYRFNSENSLISRIDAKEALIENGKWKVKEGIILKDTLSNKISNFELKTNINIMYLKKFFVNSNIFSIWNVYEQIKKIQNRGYYGQELIITFNKYLSLPILLFSMVVIATLPTIRSRHQYNNFIYSFFGVLLGIFIYFLIDLSVAVGKSGKIPLVLSVWAPIIIIITLSMYRLIKDND